MHAVEAATDYCRGATTALTLSPAGPAPPIYGLAKRATGTAAEAHGHVIIAAGEAVIVATLTRFNTVRVARQPSRRAANLSGVTARLADVRAVTEGTLIVTTAIDAIRATRLIRASGRDTLGEPAVGNRAPVPTGLAAIARGLTCLAAEHANAIRFALYQAVVAGRLTGGQALRLASLPALHAVATRASPWIIADEPIACLRIAEAARGGLSGIRRTARTTGLSAAGDAAMRLLVAYARVAHLSHIPRIGRVDPAIWRPFRCPCFRTVAADLAGATARRNTLVSRDVAAQALLTTYEWTEGRNILRSRGGAAAIFSERAARDGKREWIVHISETAEITSGGHEVSQTK